MPRSSYPHMVHDHLVSQVRQVHAARAARLEQIETADDALAYREHVRAAIGRAFAPRPKKTALHAQVTGTLDLAHYRIENLIFESRPGCLVTANLYVPHGLDGPAPCVLGTCGHSEPGKAADLYQAFSQRLARAGFVVLIYDPLSQGERDQYFRSGFREAVGWGTRAHNMMGKQLELLGENLAMWRAWDGVRALDYLLSRTEVDPAHVGVTGNSGGGTMTTWLWAIEDRFTMAAPSCFVTTFLRNLENELPADAEQCPPGVIGEGLELADFIIAAAPKPVLLMGQRFDYFDPRGLREAYEDVRSVYARLNAPEGNVALFVGPQGHGYSVHNQQAMVAFFCRHAGLPVPEHVEVEPLPEADLYAAPDGQVIDAGATPVYELIAVRGRELASMRGDVDVPELRARVERKLSLPKRAGAPHYRVLRPVRDEGTTFSRFAVETEGDVRAILWKRAGDPPYPFTLDVAAKVPLYLPHLATASELDTAPLQNGSYALDVRGLGESMPEGPEAGFLQPYGLDYMFHAYWAMLGESYLGRRVYDVLRVLDLLVDEGASSVDLHGRGQGAILAAFAALLHPAVASVTLENGPRSFLKWTQTPYVTWPAANMVYGLLGEVDLPDVLRALGDRVTVVDPWGPEMRPDEGAEEDYST
jgi:dienelactone hydrolase